MEQRRNTNRLSWLLVGGFLVLIVAINLVLFSFSSEDDKPIVLFGLFGALLPTVFLVYFWWPRDDMGALLLRVHAEAIFLWSGIALCIVLTLSDISLLIIIPLGNSSRPIGNFSLILGNSLVILFWLSILVRRIEIREKGINGPFSYIHWENIESYRWKAHEPTILLVKVKGRKLINPKRVPIHNLDKVAVNQILQERVLSWQPQPKLERPG